jgi:hypothetical protein
MYNFFQKHKSIFDYLPMMLITLLFVAESELEKHAINTSCQMVITIFIMTLFYILVIYYKNTKTISLFVCCFLWIILIYIKKSYMNL